MPVGYEKLPFYATEAIAALEALTTENLCPSAGGAIGYTNCLFGYAKL